ncbi:MAG: hypothetical protein HY882_07900 [Deltaproteobacteria bacterium]|nr:hypothetical protein [Deltaproteobacteria bacterium]
MSQSPKTPAKIHSPIVSYLWASGALFSILFWANHIFTNYRVGGKIIFAFMPMAGSIIMYLWLVLLADEFLLLLETSGPVSRIIKSLKLLSLAVIALYGAMALALWVNGISYSPAITKKAKLLSLSAIDMGLWSYSHFTITGWDGDPHGKKILGSPNDDTGLYAGADIEILLRKGILSLDRVLEIKHDMEKFYLKMLKAAPDSKVAIVGLVEIYAKRKEFASAIEWFDKLHEKYPGEADIGHDLAGWLIESRQYGQAADVLKKLLGTKRDYEVLYLLGYALAWAGEKHEAEKYLIEATELDPTDYRAFYSLGYVYRDTGSNEKAKEAWTRALEILPNFPEVERNIKSIEKNKG